MQKELCLCARWTSLGAVCLFALPPTRALRPPPIDPTVRAPTKGGPGIADHTPVPSEPGGCAGLPDGTPCDDGHPCTLTDICQMGWCVPTGTCADVKYVLAVLEAPSSPPLDCATRCSGDNEPCDTDTDCSFGGVCVTPSDCTTAPPACDTDLADLQDGQFIVEVWVQKFSPDSDPNPPLNPGIACAYVDIDSFFPFAPAPSAITHGSLFPFFQSGLVGRDGGIIDLGACTNAEPGVGVYPEWALLARVVLTHRPCDASGDCPNAAGSTELNFQLNEPTDPLLDTTIWSLGPTDLIEFGEQCDTTLPQCRGQAYELDGNCSIFTGDLAFFSACWLLCPDDPPQCQNTLAACTSDADCHAGDVCNTELGLCEITTIECMDDADCAGTDVCVGYDNALGGAGCAGVNFIDDCVSPNGCIGPDDFSFWITGFEKCCTNESIILPPACPPGARPR